MNRPLTEFVDMLRYADVPVSIGEVIDAARTIDLLGYSDRNLLKSALSQVMAKTTDEMVSFDQCFDDFFSIDTKLDLGENLLDQASETAKNDDDESSSNDDNNPLSALDDLENDPSDGGGDGGGGGEGSATSPGEVSDAQQSSLLEMLEKADRTGLTMSMNSAAEAIGLSNIVLSTQRGLFTRRILEEMGLVDVNQEISERRQDDNEEGAEELSRRLNVLFSKHARPPVLPRSF